LKVVFPFKSTFSQLVFAPFKFTTSSNPHHKPYEDVVGGYPKICNPITMYCEKNALAPHLSGIQFHQDFISAIAQNSKPQVLS